METLTKTKVLVVVDMQNDFITGSLGTKQALNIVPNVVDKIMNWDGKILYTHDTHFDDYLETKEGVALPIKHCIVGTEGWRLNEEVKLALDSKQAVGFLKYTFGSMELLNYLHAQDYYSIDEIQLIGLCTGVCVLSNAVLLKTKFYKTVNIIVDANCCACITDESHKMALEVMKLQQIKVIGE